MIGQMTLSDSKKSERTCQSEKQKNGPDRFLTSPDQFARKNFL
jgi:hypothetical protein